MRLFRALFDVFELCKCDGKLFCIFAINEPPMDPSSVTPLFLEDLSIGMKFSAGPRQITEQEIIAFAKQYDPQPFHTDPEAAKNTMFKGLAASGWHTVALTMVMLTEGGALPFANGVIGFGAEVSWLRPSALAIFSPSNARLWRSHRRARSQIRRWFWCAQRRPIRMASPCRC
jgi:acyl dehydratase